MIKNIIDTFCGLFIHNKVIVDLYAYFQKNQYHISKRDIQIAFKDSVEMLNNTPGHQRTDMKSFLAIMEKYASMPKDSLVVLTERVEIETVSSNLSYIFAAGHVVGKCFITPDKLAKAILNIPSDPDPNR